MTDIVAQIDQLAADEKCPHCGRQWHERPLSALIASMYDHNHHIGHITRGDGYQSPIVCDGSALIGPRRPPYEPTETPPGPTYSMADFTLLQPAWKLPPNPMVQFVDQVSSFSYVEYFTPPPPPPIAAFQKAMQSMTDALTTLLGLEDLSIDFGSWMLPFPGLEQEPIDCADIPTLDIEFGSQHWAAEHTAAPISLTNAVAQRWPLLTATDTHAPEPPGYDFTAYQDAVNPKQYPTTTKRRKK